MNILLISPGSSVRHSGNRCTASQWADLLKTQGHEVLVCYDLPRTIPGGKFDLLIAMHWVKTHAMIREFRSHHPRGKILLALTGTDIYTDPSDLCLTSMEMADGLIVLQRKALEKIPPPLRSKATVVIQSAERQAERLPRSPDAFDVCVVGHFRDVKNPLLTAKASRLLPRESRLRLRQAGGMLDPAYEALVAQEQEENPRYRWIGELSVEGVGRLLAASDLMVLSSHHEGGARVVGESIVHGTPVLSSRIDGIIGLLGESYPGFFPDNDADALAEMLWKVESDPEFHGRLQQAADKLRDRFAPAAEKRSLEEAIAKMSDRVATPD